MGTAELRLIEPDNLPILKTHLDRMNDRIETPAFLNHDPVQFMHAFEEKRDQEIAGFLAALLAWGRRDIVCRKIEELLKRMDFQPYQFVMQYTPSDALHFRGFKHRTFKPVDIHGLISALHQIYRSHDDLESFWADCLIDAEDRGRNLIGLFRERFLTLSEEIVTRTHKHLSNPERGSSAKRICMFLRWCNRKESCVDPGIWTLLPPSSLMIPFDVHVARQSRRIGLLTRRSNDWKAVQELTAQLSELNPNDPTRYDFALFGLGAMDYSLPDHLILN
ncbi:MAG: TIGR02757 family protein [Balneolaceae bacterium]